MIAPPLPTTEAAIRYGLSLAPSDLDDLRAEIAETQRAFSAALDEDPDDLHDPAQCCALAFRCQVLREALEAATMTGGIGDFLREHPEAFPPRCLDDNAHAGPIGAVHCGCAACVPAARTEPRPPTLSPAIGLRYAR